MGSWNLTISGAAISKAGSNANQSVIYNTTILNKWIDQVEATISTLTRYDWVTNYAKVNANFKGVLDDLASDMVAMKIVAYDLDSYGILEGTTLLDVLRDNIVRNIEILKLEENKEKMGTL